jgi:hypothetical protein
MKMKWNHWLIFSLAFWLVISPWLLGFSDLNLVLWNNVLIGALIIAFVLWRAPS